MRRSARRMVCAAGLLLLSACQMNVRLHATFEADGSGVLRLGMTLDRELLDGLRGTDDGGLPAIESLFARLGSTGWEVTRDEPAGALRLQASRRFANEGAFQAVIGELSEARAAEGDRVPLPALTMRYQGGSNVLRAHARFQGEVDTALPGALAGRVGDLVGSVRDELAQVLRYEVVVDLPGDARVRAGDAAVEGGSIVWRPQLGTRAGIVAASSGLRPVPIVALGLLLMLLAGLGVWMVARRRPSYELVVEPLALDDSFDDEPTAERVRTIRPDEVPAPPILVRERIGELEVTFDGRARVVHLEPIEETADR